MLNFDITSSEFLHDPRISSNSAEKFKTPRRKNKEDIVLDGLFWPIMPLHLVNRYLEHKSNKPNAFQEYNVPYPQNDQYKHHDESIYSIWMHFVTFCLHLQKTSSNLQKYSFVNKVIANEPVNYFSRRKRLNVFVELSKGVSQEVL